MNVRIEDDFDLQKIQKSGQAFRIACLADDKTYRFIHGEHVIYIKQIDKDRYEVSCDEAVWQTIWVPYFDLKTSYQDIRKQIPKKDTYLEEASQYGKGIRILRQEPWEMLITFIISQRKSIPAIQGAVELLAKTYGSSLDVNSEKLYSFPKPDQLREASVENLKACKLGYRAPYVFDAVGQVCSGRLDLGLLASVSDKDVVDRLMQVKGVGIKVANCVALFAYHRIGRAPVDAWIGKIIEKEYEGENPFNKYGKVAGVMQQYMFYYALSHKSQYQHK